MRYLLVLLCSGLLAGCASGLAIPAEPFEDQPAISEGQTNTPTTPNEEPTPFRAELKDYGPAPELSNEVWLNTDMPLRLAELRGNVILLEMWTFG